MSMLNEEGKQQWNESYIRGGNICFYPHEEIIRFINKYVRRKEGIDQYHNIMELTENEWENFASLDLGCGMGRHVKFLDEFMLNPSGIDLSDTAITMGKEWFRSLGRDDLAEKLIVGSVADLPYEDESFWVCVSHGTLDSMPREIATKGIQETLRVIKSKGLMYFDLIMDTQRGDKDEIVEHGYEKDTIQSYFTVDSIKKLIESKAKIVDFKIITWMDDSGNESHRRAHIIIQKI